MGGGKGAALGLIHAFAIEAVSHDPLPHVAWWKLSDWLFLLWTKHSHHSETLRTAALRTTVLGHSQVFRN